MRIALTVLVLAASTPALAQFKCVAPGGAVTVQQAPCPAGAASTAVRLPPPAAERPERIRRALAEGRIEIGMTRAEVVRAARRDPDRVNTTVLAQGLDEQFVYYGADRTAMFVYLRDGVVTSFQSDR